MNNVINGKISMSEKVLRIVAVIVFIIITAVSSFYIGTISIEKNEVAECYKLEAYSKQFNEFYLTEWQNSMCNRYGLMINAPVK